MLKRKAQRDARSKLSGSALPDDFDLRTIAQIEESHIALRGRLRAWIARGDAGHVNYVGLRRAVVRIGRSTFINYPAFKEFLLQRTAMPPSPSRRK